MAAKMPVLFVGHGSPMNAIEDNEFSRTWEKLGDTLPLPETLLCISAHWETTGTRVTAMEHPRTIHDFGGFPRALYEMQYPAPGNPRLAEKVMKMVMSSRVEPDLQWGLDHGCWSVLCRMYPAAGIPVVQLSLDSLKPASAHAGMAAELLPLREQGVMVVCSGNLVHNLRMVAWDRLNDIGYGFDWAVRADKLFRDLIVAGETDRLANYPQLGPDVLKAVPTPEHYLPMLYALSLKDGPETVTFFNDKPVAGSLTMTSFVIG